MLNAYGDEINDPGLHENDMYGDEEMLLNDDGTHMQDMMAAAEGGDDQYYYN